MASSVPWRIKRFADSRGKEPFSDWLATLDTTSRRRILVQIARLEAGNLGALKWIEKNLGEIRVDTGPGYRVYVTRRGRDLLVLLLGGDKSTQRRDVQRASVLLEMLDKDS